MKTRRKRIRDMMASALLLLALLFPSAAVGQSDSFFYIDEGNLRNVESYGSWLGMGDNTGGYGSWDGFGFGIYATEASASGTWNGFDITANGSEGSATWEGFEDGNPLPAGGGLLVLALSGVCYVWLKDGRRKKAAD